MSKNAGRTGLGLPEGFGTGRRTETGGWIPVLSSNLHRIRYADEDLRYKVPKPSMLWVQFWKKAGNGKVPGKIYVYTGVPRSVWEGLLKAGSKGKYHHQFIRNSYPYQIV